MNEFSQSLPEPEQATGPESGQSRGELEDFFENATVALHIVSGEGLILRANKAELALLGYAAEEYVGQHISNFHADADTIADILARLGRGEKLDRYPARLKAKDGSLRHVLITSSANFRDGRFLNTRCFTVDVTAETEAKQRAAQAEERFSQLLEALPAAVYTTDREGVVTYCNQAAVDLSGRKPQIGSDRWCVTWRLYDAQGEPLPLERCPMAVALKTGQPVRGVEVVAERPDGGRVPLLPFPTPLRDGSGEVIGAVNMLIDITELKRAKELALSHFDEQACLYRFTDTLYRAQSTRAIYDAALDAITSALGCGRASILLFDTTGVMRFVAWRGLSDAYRAAVEGHSPWKPGDRDPQPLCIADIETAAEPESLKAVVRAEGIRALTFIPLTVAGRTIGKFMAYRDGAQAFTENELNLALTIARQLGFSIERIRADEQRRDAGEALRRHEAHLQFVTDHVPVLIVHCDSEARFRFVNQPYAERLGLSPGEVVGKAIHEIVGVEAYKRLRPHVEAVLQGKRVDFEEIIPYERIGPRWVSSTCVPQHGPDGKAIGFIAVVQDVTERKESEAALRRAEAALHDQQDLTQIIMENATTAIFMMDDHGRCTFMNPAAECMTGYAFEEVCGGILHDVIHHHHPDGRPYRVSDCPIDRALPERVKVADHEDIFIRKSGEFFPVLVNAKPISKGGSVVGTVIEVRDLTEQKRAERQRAVLIHELNHRVKNTLATVQSLAMQTLRNTERSADARGLFEARLAALSRAHDLLTIQNWGDASLRDIVGRALGPFQTQEHRIAMEGPEIYVSPKQALALSMALHELATNAAKYGALSSAGRVLVTWKRVRDGDRHHLRLMWSEEGGPPVEPPERKGFGSRMIERHLSSELGGSVALDFRRQGVACTIDTPLGWGKMSGLQIG
jgi:PAS domain S-box-containing protein